MTGWESLLSLSAIIERSIASFATSESFPAFAWKAISPWMGATDSQTDSFTERWAAFALSKSSPMSWKRVSSSIFKSFRWGFRLSNSSKYVKEDVKNADHMDVLSNTAVTADLACAESRPIASCAHSDFQTRSSHPHANDDVFERTNRESDFASSDSS